MAGMKCATATVFSSVGIIKKEYLINIIYIEKARVCHKLSAGRTLCEKSQIIIHLTFAHTAKGCYVEATI